MSIPTISHFQQCYQCILYFLLLDSKSNAKTYKALERVEDRIDELEEHPEQHLIKVDRQLKFAADAEKRRLRKLHPKHSC